MFCRAPEFDRKRQENWKSGNWKSSETKKTENKSRKTSRRFLLDSCKMSDSPLDAAEFSAWARRELHFVPKDADGQDAAAFRKLCVGAMEDKWRHLVRHVRHADQVDKIRGNIRLKKNRAAAVGNDTTCMTSVDAAVATEKEELIAEIERARRHLRRATAKSATAKAAVVRHRRDSEHQIGEAKAMEAAVAERRKMSGMVQALIGKSKAETAGADAKAAEIIAAEDLFRSEHEEKVFQDVDEGVIKNAAQVNYNIYSFILCRPRTSL